MTFMMNMKVWNGKGMLKKDRQKKIREYIEANGLASVSELAEKFRVSDMTIRRDLEHLSSQQLIERIHGGAVANNAGQLLNQPPLMKRMGERVEEKKKIAQAVARIINPDEKIFLGSGTTTYFIAEELKNRPDLTLFTNALTVANLLAFSGVNIIMIGGMLRKSEMALIGQFAISNLEGLRVDKVIFGTYGVHPEYGFTSDHPEEVATDQALMKIGKELIIVADHSKFGTISTVRTAHIHEVDLIVTSNYTPSEVVNKIREQGTRVICA